MTNSSNNYRYSHCFYWSSPSEILQNVAVKSTGQISNKTQMEENGSNCLKEILAF